MNASKETASSPTLAAYSSCKLPARLVVPAFREVFAAGIRVFSLVYQVKPEAYAARSQMCYKCMRFRKNAIKLRSPLFN